MLNELCNGGFRHNEQSVRIVEKLEKEGKGLNLTWEVRDGILNHQISLMPSTLEGKIVRLSDKIAYINHDIDDAIRAQVLQEEDIPVKYREVLGFSTQERLNTLIHDIIEQSWEKNEICMSPDVAQAMQGLRQFMFQNVYTNPVAKGEETKAKELLERLFVYYLKHIDLLPGYYLQMLEDGEIDVIPNLRITPDREDRFDFTTSPVGTIRQHADGACWQPHRHCRGVQHLQRHDGGLLPRRQRPQPELY